MALKGAARPFWRFGSLPLAPSSHQTSYSHNGSSLILSKAALLEVQLTKRKPLPLGRVDQQVRAGKILSGLFPRLTGFQERFVHHPPSVVSIATVGRQKQK